MPIVSGMGGNAGTQTMAVAVRALATNQLTSSNTIRQIAREFRIASANGLSLGLLIGIATTLIYGNLDLGIVIALSMLINNLVAGLAGILVPVTLEKAGVDRSEEHTSALQSLMRISYAVFCLKQKIQTTTNKK